jgi:hypothetical protein
MVWPMIWDSRAIGGNVMTQSRAGQLEECKPETTITASCTLDDESGRVIASVLEVKNEIPV